MENQQSSTVITGQEQRKGISGWWVAIIVAVVVLFCIFCISVMIAYFILADILFDIFNQISFQIA